MIQAVYDTNVVVAGLLNPDGLPAVLLDLATQNRIQLIPSRFVLRECETVLRRPKFGFPPAKIRSLIRAISSHATLVNPRETIQVLSDPSDNQVLACAVEGRVDYLVTGNTRDFHVSAFRGVSIVSPRRLWEIYQASFQVSGA